MKPDNLEFGWATEGDSGEIGAFLEKAFGPTSFQAHPARQRWLYFDNPLGLHIAFCRAQGQIVALCPHVPQMIPLRGNQILAGFGIDFFVIDQWRRRGIGREFLNMRLERFPLSLSTGQSSSMGTLYANMGATDLGPFHMGYFRKHPPLRGEFPS